MRPLDRSFLPSSYYVDAENAAEMARLSRQASMLKGISAINGPFRTLMAYQAHHLDTDFYEISKCSHTSSFLQHPLTDAGQRVTDKHIQDTHPTDISA
jgi:hypothetical protein